MKGAGRIAFLARKTAIQEKIEAGYPLLAIYQEYEKKLPIGYGQFVRYVNLFISKPRYENEGERFISAEKNSTQLIAPSFDINRFIKRTHFTLQGKGGVGKSLMASLIVQYLRSKGEPVVAIDADPVSATLSGYKVLEAQRLELMDGGTIVEGKFDAMMLRIFEEDSNFVIDNGPSSFLPLKNYLLENDAINMIADHGKQVVIHTVLTGGQSLYDTVSGFYNLITQFPDKARFVIWLNPYLGQVVKDGKNFTEFKAYKKNKDRVSGIVNLPELQHQIYGRDLSDMLENFLTFNEVAESPEFGQMSKSRLAQVKKAIFDQLDTVI